jgi:hypothetical protein
VAVIDEGPGSEPEGPGPKGVEGPEPPEELLPLPPSSLLFNFRRLGFLSSPPLQIESLLYFLNYFDH